MSGFDGYIVLAFYAVLATILTTVFSRGYNKTKDGFLVADRKLGYFQGTLSITAAWIWAPAMFISCLQGYVNGFSGVFWMVMGSFFAVFLFGFIAPKIKRKYPNGFTLSSLMQTNYGSRVQLLFATELILLALGALSSNILAGSMAISVITGINFTLISIIIPVIALSYALRGGLKASVVTEIIKVFIFLTVWLGLIAWTISANGGFDVIAQGFGGKTGNGNILWGTDFTNNVLLAFSIPTILSLLSGTWADNVFYQRVFSIEEKHVKKSFLTAAFLAVSVTVAGGLLGMLAAGMHIDVPKELLTYTNIFLFGMTLPQWVYPILMFVIFASLISIIDSQLGTAASVFGNDFYNAVNKTDDDTKSVLYSRVAMCVIAAVAVGIVNIPGITLLQIFLIYGISRTTVWIPTMLTVLKPNLTSEKGMFWGILLAWFFGLPTFIYGDLFGGGNLFKLAGTLIAVFGSGLLTLIISKLSKNENI